MFTFFFTDQQVIDWNTAKRSDTERFKKFFHFMLESGIYLAPSQFEAAFLSYAHTDQDIETTVAAARDFFAQS
jgi:glutamate-1-semialdehyde 2,1-aminomutase